MAAYHFDELVREDSRQRREFIRETVERLRGRGDGKIWFEDGSSFFGDDFDECTVDGVHASDLGFRRIADALEPVLRKCLE